MGVSLERVLNGEGVGLIHPLCGDMPWKNPSSNYIITTRNQNLDFYRKEIYLGDEDFSV